MKVVIKYYEFIFGVYFCKKSQFFFRRFYLILEMIFWNEFCCVVGFCCFFFGDELFDVSVMFDFVLVSCDGCEDIMVNYIIVVQFLGFGVGVDRKDNCVVELRVGNGCFEFLFQLGFIFCCEYFVVDGLVQWVGDDVFEEGG